MGKLLNLTQLEKWEATEGDLMIECELNFPFPLPFWEGFWLLLLSHIPQMTNKVNPPLCIL